VGSASGEALSLQRLGVLLTARGELEPGMAVLEEGMVVAERATLRSHCLARIYASLVRNRLAAADRAGAEGFERLGEETLERHGHCVTCNALVLPEAVRVRLALGDLAAAEAFTGKLEAAAGRFDSAAWRGLAGQARGRVLLARGDGGGAAAMFRAAGESFAALDADYEVARCCWAAARAHEAAGSSALAGALRRKAEATYRRLGAPGVEEPPRALA
jgi:hypothetical protein